MITKWKVSNFKSILEAPEFEFRPLTIFAGANSSGKSTVIQSVLLIAQTLAHKIGSRSMVLNGTLTSLGQFDDLLSSNATSKQIEIQCTCEPLARSQFSSSGMAGLLTPRGIVRPYGHGIREVSCKVAFDAGDSSESNDFYQIQPRIVSSEISTSIRNEGLDERFSISVVRSEEHPVDIIGDSEFDEIDERSRQGFAYNVQIDERSLGEVQEEYRSASPVGCVLRHFLPERIHFQVDSLTERANAIANALLGFQNRPRTFRFAAASRIVIPKEVVTIIRENLSDLLEPEETFPATSSPPDHPQISEGAVLLSDWVEWVRSLPTNRRMEIVRTLRSEENLFESVYGAMQISEQFEVQSFSFVTEPPPRIISGACRYLDSFFSSSVKYLGPLRDEPKPLFPLARAADPNDVGLRGEHTAAILELHKTKNVRYIPSTNFSSSSVEQIPISISLETAVNDWLRYLGVAECVTSTDKGKLGHELKVELATSAFAHDLTHVGVGVSQVLPILVMCLLADADSTLVFEQPELHLHPRVQSRLGDFFLSMALCNKQCIVETHSEYLIDRIRFRIAAQPIDRSPSEKPLQDQVKMFFVEKTGVGSSFREVVVNEYGAIVDWPDGFFDQSQQQAEEILRAAALKRKAARNKGNE